MKIGIFSFGGGYAMIPMILKEVKSHGWLSDPEFFDLVAIAEMTPGPIAVNSATFVGYKAAGFWGGLVATIGVAIPSLVLILIISKYFYKFQHRPIVEMAFYGIKPIIVGLIMAATILMAQATFLNYNISLKDLGIIIKNPLSVINIRSLFIFFASLISMVKFRTNPFLIILFSGILGLVIFSI